MKTFDEAVKISSVLVPCPDGPESAEVKAALDRVTRFGSIFEEAARNETVQMVKEVFMQAVSTGEVRPQDALITMFIMGLQTGIEMERAE